MRSAIAAGRLLQGGARKEKVSVSLSGGVTRAIDELADAEGRSAFVERALRVYIRSLVRRAQNKRDREAIDLRSKATNHESDRTLELQAWPE